MSSVYKGTITLSIFGESHGEAIGVVLDGLPPGLALDMAAIEALMDRRKPGGALATKRKESDQVRIVSGLHEGVTTGAPLTGLIFNENTRSGDYDLLRTRMRPGHSDFPGHVRYRGFNDHRGGGHFSGRLTAPFVFAGAVALEYLKEYGVLVGGHLLQIHQVRDEELGMNPSAATLAALKTQDLPVLSPEVAKAMTEVVEAARAEGDSVGGIVECVALGVRPGIGSPMMNSLESRMASLLYAIPGVKSVSFGDGADFALLKGSEANDPYHFQDGEVRVKSNHNGGILGGISNGAPIRVQVVLKATSSIAKEQDTVDLETGENVRLAVTGRHDPCIAIRGVPVVEAAVAIALLDAYLEDKEWD